MISDWINALIGGVLIGLASTTMLLFNGRIAGVSGIFLGMLISKGFERWWRLLFVLGLFVGGALMLSFSPDLFRNESGRSISIILLAGLLVGFGTRMGNGCTSGHGVCGISRLSLRSLVATLSFILSGVVTVFIVGR